MDSCSDVKILGIGKSLPIKLPIVFGSTVKGFTYLASTCSGYTYGTFDLNMGLGDFIDEIARRIKTRQDYSPISTTELTSYPSFQEVIVTCSVFGLDAEIDYQIFLVTQMVSGAKLATD